MVNYFTWSGVSGTFAQMGGLLAAWAIWLFGLIVVISFLTEVSGLISGRSKIILSIAWGLALSVAFKFIKSADWSVAFAINGAATGGANVLWEYLINKFGLHTIAAKGLGILARAVAWLVKIKANRAGKADTANTAAPVQAATARPAAPK